MNLLKKIYHWSSTWTGTIVIVLSVIFFVAQAFVIPSGSMKNSLLVGDMLFAKKFAYGIPTPRLPWLEIKLLPDFSNNGHLIEGEKPKRGDIVIFRYPHNEKIHYVKRCVATGGDILYIKDKALYLHLNEGNDYIKKNYKDYELVTIDDTIFIKDPYKKEHPGIHHDNTVVNDGRQPIQLFDTSFIEVPKNQFFMMGDNRDHSNDSRFWGTVEYKYIVGTPWFIYFSWDKDYNIRWDRIFKTPKQLEETKYIKNKNLKHKEGIY